MKITEAIQKRILVLDGAMGTMIQQLKLSDQSFFNPRTNCCETSCNELLNINRPDVVRSIHNSYIDAGCDIIETNTFCANGFSLDEYGLEDEVRDINLRACQIAKDAIAGREVLVAGVLGPTKENLALSTNVDDLSYRKYDFDQFVAMYLEQARALLDGGVDLFLIETVFDTLVAKAAIHACLQAMEEKQAEIPLMVSVTFSDNSGRMLCGQDLESMVTSLSQYPLFSLGLNCSTGAKEMAPVIEKLASISPFYVTAHPNAGFPDKEGNYTVGPEENAGILQTVVEKGCVNILGGCCGTTEKHIKAIRKMVEGKKPHQRNPNIHELRLCSLETKQVEEGRLLVVGERTNVAGSAKFAQLVSDGRWDEALAIARKEVQQKADVLDICMDAPLLDAKECMVVFLRNIASDPSVGRIPVMIDSSDFSVIVSAMKEVQGRCIVNSISLKEGEGLFIQKAKIIQRFGHAMVVMLFDEQGQADTYEKKIACAQRSYDLLMQNGIRSENIIFDANVLSIATGIDSHDAYAKAFIDATSWIKANLKHVHTSGGVSNLSFSFRGNNTIREALHCVFLSLASLDMAIINPASNRDVSLLDSQTVKIIREALTLSGPDPICSREALIELAKVFVPKKIKKDKEEKEQTWKTLGPRERLAQSVIHGDDTYLQEDLKSLENDNPLSLVEGPLMQGMEQVGALFGEGKLFLPQVVRCARTMKVAVDILQPRISDTLSNKNAIIGHQKRKVVVMATVKGDVHDIGKNIVCLVLSCNNFEVHDLGVMVDKETIYQKTKEYQANLVGLSGLITPSLKEMAYTISYFQSKGSTIPIFVGGATTSILHTALKLAPLYSGQVIHTTDASSMVMGALKAASEKKDQYFAEIQRQYVDARNSEREKLIRKSYAEAVSMQTQKQEGSEALEYGVFTIDEFPVDELVQKIDYRSLVLAWKVPMGSDEAAKLTKDARNIVFDDSFLKTLREGSRAVYGIFPAHSDRMKVSIGDKDFFFLRNEATGLCLADFIAVNDTVGMFVVSSQLACLVEEDPYLKVMKQLLYDRMAEVLAQYTQNLVMAKWGCTQKVIRPAPGYPTYNDHSEKKNLFEALSVSERIGITLTENYAMNPPASICALVIASDNARYFNVGKVGKEQLSLYAKCKGMSPSSLENFILETE